MSVSSLHYSDMLGAYRLSIEVPQPLPDAGFPVSPRIFRNGYAYASNVPSSPIVASQERPNKRRRHELEDNDTTNQQQRIPDAGMASGPFDSQTPRRLPSAKELAQILSPATPKTVSFEDEENENLGSQYEDKRRRISRHDPKPHQIQYYTPISRGVLRTAKSYYRDKIFTNNAYPGNEERSQLGHAAWEHAVQANANTFPHASTQHFSPSILRLIADTAWASRGLIKSEAKRLVPGHYKLHPPDSLEIVSQRRAQEYTRDRVKYLFTKHRFLSGDFQGVSTSAHLPRRLLILVNSDPTCPSAMSPSLSSSSALSIATSVSKAGLSSTQCLLRLLPLQWLP